MSVSLHNLDRLFITGLTGLLLIGLLGCPNGDDEYLTAIQATPTPLPIEGTPTLEPAVTSRRVLMPGMTWQWQLTGSIDTSVAAAMYDIDLFDASLAVIERLHADGRTVICYFSAGSWENWRPDAGQFPDSIKGDDLEDWLDEQWLDIRQIDLLEPLMQARLDLAVEKGCDGVEPDNVDAYTNDSGFPLTYADQIRYNRWLADEAHGRGLSILLKNDVDQVGDLLPYFDGALSEQCFEYQECEQFLPFIQAGKAVFGVEYELEIAEFCPQANAWNFSGLKKHWNLDAWRQTCW